MRRRALPALFPPAMPFLEYRADDFSGGSLVVGALASGFFRLFGPTVFALKLTPLLLFTLALVWPGSWNWPSLSG